MRLLERLIIALRFLGLPTVIRSLFYSLRRDRLDRRYPPPEEAPPQSPGVLTASEAGPHGVDLRFTQAALHVRPLNDRFLCFSWDNAAPMPPYAIARTDWPGAAVEVDTSADGSVHLKTNALTAHVVADGSLTLNGADGITLFSAGAPSFHAPGWTLPLRLQQEEHIYGLGERSAPLNRRGGAYRMWNQDPGGSYNEGYDPLYVNVPMFIGLHPDGCYLFYLENAYDAHFDFGDAPAIRAAGGCLRFYFTAGTPREVLAAYHELTGRQPLPPRWALGYHQSRWGYKSEGDVRAVAQGFKAHGLPLDAIHLDIDYMDGYRLFSVDKSRFPDMAGLAADLLQDGVHLVTILDVGIRIDAHDPIYRSGLEKDAYCKLPDGSHATAPVWPGECAFPDFTRPDVRAWWGGLYRSLLDAGVSGFWHDMNEPAAFTAWGEPTLPACTLHDLDGQPGDHRQAHSLYALLINRAADEGLRSLAPDRRPWMVTRAGWAGIGRYAWKWTGDVNGTWEMLRRSVSIFLGLSLSGESFVGSDVGGFSSHPTPELYVRWFQLGAFSPFFRTHSATGLPSREPWQFGEEVLTATGAALRLRRALTPYFYTAAWFTAEKAEPMLRPLFWDEPSRRALWDVDDVFMLGDSILAAPVLWEGHTQRRISLPAGAWYEGGSDALHAGLQTITLPAPLERIPWLVRAGKLLPLAESETLIMEVYAPQEDGREKSWLYSDAGDGYGPSRLETWTLSRSGDTLEIAWETEGEFAWPYVRIELRLYGFEARAAVSDGRSVQIAENRIIFDKPFRRLSMQG